MIRLPRCRSAVVVMLMLTAVFALAACSSNVKTQKAVAQAKANGKFDMVVQAYKDGQFKLDGAILSGVDLGSHFAYLNDQGRLPDSVLLEPTDDSDVKSVHLRYMATIADTYHFKVYYMDDGELRVIMPRSADKTASGDKDDSDSN
ncbi:MAG TPA: hypothetical protein VFJ15_05075 [Oleiagrimonas sp.]|nr:hypothetical protein [Oleiagrimonas sp.]